MHFFFHYSWSYQPNILREKFSLWKMSPFCFKKAICKIWSFLNYLLFGPNKFKIYWATLKLFHLYMLFSPAADVWFFAVLSCCTLLLAPPAVSCHPQRHSLGQSHCKSTSALYPCCQTDLSWSWRLPSPSSVSSRVYSHVRQPNPVELSLVGWGDSLYDWSPDPEKLQGRWLHG